MTPADPSLPKAAPPQDAPPPIPPVITGSRWRSIVIGGSLIAVALVFGVWQLFADPAQTPSVAAAAAVSPDAGAQSAVPGGDSAVTPPAPAPAQSPAPTGPDTAAILRANLPGPNNSVRMRLDLMGEAWMGEMEERPITTGDRWRALFAWHRSAKNDAYILVHNTHSDAMQTFVNLFGQGDNPAPYARETHHFDLALPTDARHEPRIFRCVMRPSLIVCGYVPPGERVLVTLQQRAETAVAQQQGLDELMFGIAGIELKQNARDVLGALQHLGALELHEYKP